MCLWLQVSKSIIFTIANIIVLYGIRVKIACIHIFNSKMIRVKIDCIHIARRSAESDWLPESLHYIGCNLLDREETLSKLSRLQDVTHLFYVTWVNRHHDQHSALPQHSRRIAAECQKLSAHRVAEWDEALSRPVWTPWSGPGSRPTIPRGLPETSLREFLSRSRGHDIRDSERD